MKDRVPLNFNNVVRVQKKRKVKRGPTIAERLHSHANALWGACDCDGRGCAVCLAIDVMLDVERALRACPRCRNRWKVQP